MSTPLYYNGPTTNMPNPTPLHGGEIKKVPANVQAGPNTLNIDTQSVLSQLSTRVALNKEDISLGQVPAAVGPYTGTKLDFKVSPGPNSQMAARQEQLYNSVVNAVERARTLESKQASTAASERFWWATLEYGLNREGEHWYTLDKAPTAEFSKALALATNGLLSTKDLVEGINSGELGYTSSQALAQNRRLDSTGLVNRTARS